MTNKMVIKLTKVSNNTLSNLGNRDVALWVHDFPINSDQRAQFIKFLGLPWRLILFEGHDSELINALEVELATDDQLARKRGFVNIVDKDPSRLELPPRCLPIYLLDGRESDAEESSFETLLRRMTMLEELRRSSVRELLILSDGKTVLPKALKELWLAGYRAQLTFASTSINAKSELKQWIDDIADISTVTLIQTISKSLTD